MNVDLVISFIEGGIFAVGAVLLLAVISKRLRRIDSVPTLMTADKVKEKKAKRFFDYYSGKIFKDLNNDGLFTDYITSGHLEVLEKIRPQIERAGYVIKINDAKTSVRISVKP